MNLRFLLLIGIAILVNPMRAWSQIDSANSAVQALTYWNKGEKQSYSVHLDKIKIKNGDTTSHQTTSYDVDITVLDSTAEGYTVEWQYHNMAAANTPLAFKKIIEATRDMRVIFKIDQNGTFESVVNDEEIRGYIQNAMSMLRKQLKVTASVEPVLANIEAMYSTKEAIESASIKDILQFHAFYGVKFAAGDTLSGKLQVNNIFNPEKPFDADFIAYLDTINHADNNYIVRSEQQVDAEQLGDAMLDFMVDMATKMKAKKMPTRADLPDLQHEVLTASRLHDDGWIIYSLQTTTVTTEDSTNIEERIIELK
jgi:hypothetical protein